MLFSKTVLVSLALSLFSNAAAIPETENLSTRDVKFIKLDFDVTKSVQGDTFGHGPKTGPGENVKRFESEEFTLYNKQIYYSLNVAVGSDKQPQTLDIDTGSSDFWVINKDATCQKGECKEFGTFDESTSTSYVSTTSPFSIQYGDLSTSQGVYGKDSVTLQSGHVLDQLQFGNVDTTSLNFGLIGIGFKSLESTKELYDNFPIALKKQGLIDTNGYSLNLNAPDAETGSVIFGAYDTAKVTGAFPELPITSPYYLAVKLPSVTINENKIPITGQALLDSGTTITYVPKAAFQAIGKEFKGAYYAGLDVYFISCNQPSDKFVTYNFNGVDVKVPFSDLTGQIFSGDSPVSGICVLNIMAATNKDENGEELTILGDNFLSRAYTAFNLDEKTIRVGQASYSTDDNVVAF